MECEKIIAVKFEKLYLSKIDYYILDLRHARYEQMSTLSTVLLNRIKNQDGGMTFRLRCI